MNGNGTNGNSRIHMMATLFCGCIGLAGVVGEIICRINKIEGPLSFTTLTGVVIGALASAVPGWSQSTSITHIPPK